MEHSPLFPFDDDEAPSPRHRSPPYYSEFCCPRCGSSMIESRNYATKAGCAIGTLAGIGTSLAGNLRSTRMGLTIGMRSGPLGMALGGVAGAILDALSAGAAGCATGMTLGQIIDRTILNNQKCHRCGHNFSLP